MSIGMIATKLGMTRIFTEAGRSIPITVVHAPKNYITQVKTSDSDGYFALQLSAGVRKPNKANKVTVGHYKKTNTPIGRNLHEFRVTPEEVRPVGDRIGVDVFNEGEAVDVTGVSKGKGFAGAVKRHNFHMQDATHGNSLSHRALGSTGQCQSPGRVFKGKKMAGHMGSEQVTTKNLEVVAIDAERELLMIKGAIPGSTGSQVWITHRKIVLPPEPKEEAQNQEAQEIEVAVDSSTKPALETKSDTKKTPSEETNEAEKPS